MFTAVLSFIFMIDYGFAHMCLINPYQRGGLIKDINTVAPECNVNGTGTSPGRWPCFNADNPDERISQFIGRGAEQIFVMQKNVDHYNKKNPGNFTFNLFAYNTGTGEYTFEAKLGSQPDLDSNGQQEFYQITTHVPQVSAEHQVVQGIYYTNTIVDGKELTYYQCSDVLAI